MIKQILSRGVGLCTLVFMLSAGAQTPEPAKETTTDVAPQTVIVQKEEKKDFDQIRLRGGFSFNGGYAFGAAQGPVASIGARLGVQFFRFFSVYYQALPMAYFVIGRNTVAGGGIFANSAIANFTLFDMLELGAGPSFDYSADFACTADPASCTAGSGPGFGLHGRIALIIGGRQPEGGRRSGFAIGLDVHPVFVNGRYVFLTTLGIGAEWF